MTQPKLRVIELTSVPRSDSNIADASVLVLRDATYISYEARTDPEIALMRFNHPRRVITNGPNDEGFHRHPYASLGLEYYRIQEIVDSPWIAEVSASCHKDGRPDWLIGCRHFVVALKETTVDVAAEDVAFVGLFCTHAEAMRHAIE